MKTARIALIVVLAMMVGVLSSCARKTAPISSPDTSGPSVADSGMTENTPEKLHVVVSIPPQAYFVERVGGTHVTVEALIGPGQSPATFEPTPAQMTALADCDVYFRIGVPFESSLLEKIQSQVHLFRAVDTRDLVPLRTISGEKSPQDPRTKLVHPTTSGPPLLDPHIWLDPALVKIQAATIANELTRIDPANGDSYSKNLVAFQADLDALDARLREALAPVKGQTLLVFHPAFGYFADAYGMKQQAIEIEGKEPGARELGRIIAEAKASGVKVVFVQKEFSTASASAIAEQIGGAVVKVDPLAQDYIHNMEAMAATVRDGLSESAQ